MTRQSVRAWSLIAFVGVAGCNSAPSTSAKVVQQKAAPAEELADAVHETLQKSNDLAACRRAIEQINVAIGRTNATQKPDAMPAELKDRLVQGLGLTPRETEELSRTEFTPLDAFALEEAYLFRDLAHSLDVAQMAPIDRARAALDWVFRNIRTVDARGPAAPPAFVAVRGSGSTLEKTYVLLALLRQMGLDAALIGDPTGEPDKMWGVAVRTDDGVFAFDVRLGMPFSGSNGGVATLAQFRSDESVLKPWSSVEKLPYDVTPERAKSARIYVAEPLSALASRQKFLLRQLPSGAPQVTGDVAALRDRFAKSAPGVDVVLWNSPAVDAWTRALMTFLPPNEGGTDQIAAGPSRRDRFLIDQVPWGAVPPHLLQLAGEPGDRIRSSFATRVLGLRQPGQSAELMLRGQFHDATEQLVALQSKLSARPLSETQAFQESQGWAEAAREVYADLLRAERAAKTDPAAAASIAEIRLKIDNLWKKSLSPNILLDIIASPIVDEEATYLLAIGKHEQAERAAHRQKGDVAASWDTTRKWWIQFLNTYPNSAWAAPARRNFAMALLAGGSPEAAKAEFLTLANSPSLPPLERLACAIRANQIRGSK